MYSPPPISRRILPAEWAPQSAVMLTWPHPDTDWADQLERVCRVFGAIGREVALRERLLVVCHDTATQEAAEHFLRHAEARMDAVRFAFAPSNDTWARDHGPITVLEDGRPRLLDFAFNAWGLKYAADRDNLISRRLHAQGAFGDTPLTTLGLVLEGGGIESDGAGTILTTESVLLSPNRNPHLDKAGVEAALREHLGAERVLWLTTGRLKGDDTDGHIDTIARFANAETIVYQSCHDEDDESHTEFSAMEKELLGFRTLRDQPYRLIPLPWPGMRERAGADGGRLPATYANFLIMNGAVLVPTYDDPADPTALRRLREAFPDRDVVGIDCVPIVEQFGSLHCLTMQIPEGVVS